MISNPQPTSSFAHLGVPWRPLRSQLSLFFLFPILTGCMVGPHYKIPTSATAPSFKETDPNWQPASPADTIPRGNWWTLFNDPGLNALEPQIATANETLKIADANLRAARASIRIQRANLFPTLGANPFVGGVRASANQPYFNAANANNGDANLILPLDLNYEIDLWGAVRRGVNAAREESQATAADRETALLSLQA